MTKRTYQRRGAGSQTPLDSRPWNDPHTPLKLYVAPWIKDKLGLTCQTTQEYLMEIESKK